MRVNRRTAGVAMLASLRAGAQPAAAPSVGATLPLIPIDQLFRRAQHAGLKLSHDARFLAGTALVNDRRNLVVVDVEQRKASVLTAMRESDVMSIHWATDDRLLYTTGDVQGLDERSFGGLFAIDRDGGRPATLVEPVISGETRVRLVLRQTRPMMRVPGSAEEIFVSANDRSEDTQDVYRMNIRTGRKALVSVSSPGQVIDWVLDASHEPRAALSMDPGARRWWFSYRRAGSDRWRIHAEWDEQLRDVIIPYMFDPADPRLMLVRSNVGRDTLAFFRFDPDAGRLGEMLVGTDRYDMGSFELLGAALGESGGLLFSGTPEEPRKLIGVRFDADRQTTVWFDDEARRLQAAIDAALPGRVNQFDPTRPRSLIVSYSATQPTEWYLFDREKRQIEGSPIRSMPWIDSRQMAPMSYVTYAARDGLTIGAYLTLPPGSRKGSPLPFVVLPHGGPWARDIWHFDRDVQFLASRGYAVLQPNFRGSTGYGARHLRGSYKQWGGTMTDDIVDGVEWAIRQGLADRNRIGVYGASYGGFAALSVMVKRPDLFRWGVNYVGVTDLAVHQDTQLAQLRGNFANLARALTGDQATDAALFEAQSPARHAARFAAPVFHAYGGEDRNVDVANGAAIRAAMEKAGKPFEWMFVADEAHGYRQTRNIHTFYDRFEAFIRKHTPPPA
jgi:dipeptidyl aminopeptidase/acylaminoacyl peptidase